MALTKEDLQAIKSIVDDSVSGLKEDVGILKEDVSGLKEDVGILKEDVSGLKEDVEILKEDVSGLKEDVEILKENVSGLKTSVDTLNDRVDDLENEVRIIKVDKLENGALKILNDMSKNYSDTYQRYRNGADKFEVAFIDIDNLKKTVTKHSKQIKKLQKA